MLLTLLFLLCSSSCAKSRKTDETKASLTAPIVEVLVLSQASVGDKTDQNTLGVSELNEHEEVSTGAK